jgi:hypothetical protein
VINPARVKPPVATPLPVLVKSTGFPLDLLKQIARHGEHIRQLRGMNDNGDEVPATGVLIDIADGQEGQIFGRLSRDLPPGYLAFCANRGYGTGPDGVAVLRAKDRFDPLRVMGTNGANFNIDTAKVISTLQEWDRRFGLELTGAGMDWTEARFKRQPPDMLAFAKEVNKFCPDVVDQGTGTVEALADEMKKENSVYLWWD